MYFELVPVQDEYNVYRKTASAKYGVIKLRIPFRNTYLNSGYTEVKLTHSRYLLTI